METFNFWDWVWARHANELSWYIRPLFLIPFCYFAFRRSIWGMVWTLVALATSMFWFPAPANPNPQVVEFLEMEQKYLRGQWSPAMVVAALAVPLGLGLLAMAFWYRRWQFGLGIMAVIAFGKIFWSLLYGGESGQPLIAPALLGLIICGAAVLWAVRRNLFGGPGRRA